MIEFTVQYKKENNVLYSMINWDEPTTQLWLYDCTVFDQSCDQRKPFDQHKTMVDVFLRSDVAKTHVRRSREKSCRN